jgi:hypothetical protein
MGKKFQMLRYDICYSENGAKEVGQLGWKVCI